MTPRHVHAREAETFIVVDGALEGWCEGQVSLIEAGQLIHLPANREHAYRVVSDRAHYYLLITPADFEKFFLATGYRARPAVRGRVAGPGAGVAGEGRRAGRGAHAAGRQHHRPTTVRSTGIVAR